MNMYDFNDAERQVDYTALPAGTIVKIGISVKSGGHGEGGLLKKTAPKKQGDPAGGMLQLDCTVLSQPHAKRRIFDNLVVEHPNQQTVQISRSKIRAMINSARGIDPKDNSPNAAAGRVITGFADLHGMVIVARLGIEDSPGYKPKNVLDYVVEPGDAHYQEVMAGATFEVAEKAGNPAAGQAAAAQWGAPTPQAAQQPVQQQLPVQQQQVQQPNPPAGYVQDQAYQPNPHPAQQPGYQPQPMQQPVPQSEYHPQPIQQPAQQPAQQPQPTQEGQPQPTWAQQPVQ